MDQLKRRLTREELAKAALFLASAGAQAHISGTVTSAQEGAMEGVLVSVKKEGSTITTTVVTNDKGVVCTPRQGY